MATCETILNEQINFFRLSCLLITEGTTIVRKRFDERVVETKKTFCALLKEKEREMERYWKKIGKPKLLTDEQWRRLYENDFTKYAQNAKRLDLTLLSLLFDIFLKIKGPDSSNNWRQMPKENDRSWQADIVRLRYKRNKLFAHVVCIAITDDEYCVEFREISDILLRLGTKSKEIVEYAKLIPSEQGLESNRRQLQQLFEDDLGDFQAFGERIFSLSEKVLEKAQCTDTSLQTMTAQMKSLLGKANRSTEERKELSQTVTGSCKRIVSLIGSQDTAIRDIICHIHEQKIANGIMETVIKTILDQNKEVTKMLSEQAAEMKHQTSMITSFRQSSAKLDQPVPSLDQFRWLFLNEDNTSFRILMLTSPSTTVTTHGDEQWTELGRALGLCPWDVIIDLDTKTKLTGHMFDVLSQTLNDHKNSTLKTYAELSAEFFSGEKQDEVARGQITLYLMALGCVDKHLHEDTDFNEPIISTVATLRGLLQKAHGNKMLVTMLLVSNPGTHNYIRELVKRLEYDCKSVKSGSQYFVINLGDENDSLPDLDFVGKRYEDSTINPLLCCANQVESFFLSTFKKSLDEHVKVAGDCTFSKRIVTTMSQSLNLYYDEIGAERFRELSDDKKTEEKIKVKYDFLHGAPLTPEALYVNEKQRVFIKRKEMDEILRRVKGLLLEQTRARAVKSTVFEIRHAPSGGGTTCGRFLLYTLRNEFPCVEITEICESLYTYFQKIYNSCKYKVCVILLDMPDVDSSEVRELKNRLTNMGIGYLIIHVKMRPYYDSPHSEALSVPGSSDDDAPRNIYYLKSEAHNDDLEDFKILYEQTTREQKDKPMNTRYQTVFLFGLLAFCKLPKYMKTIEHHIDTFMSQSTELQRRVLRLCCVTSCYAERSKSIKIDLFFRMSDLSRNNTESVQELFGIARDFLLITPEDVQLAVAQRCIVDLFWKRLLSESNEKAFHCIVQDIKVLIQKDKTNKKDSTEFILCLLEKRDIPKNWSPFIEDLSKACGNEEVETLLKDILELVDCETYGCQRIRCVYAKYLMYKLGRRADSLRQMKRALQLCEDDDIHQVDTTDSEMLSVYGNLCRKNVKRISGKFRWTDSDGDKLSVMLKEASRSTEEALFVYRRAQQWKSTGINKQHHPLPFWGEAFAYSTYANLVLMHKYGNDHIKFNQYINGDECDDCILNGFVVAATNALDKLEFLKRNDRIYDNRPDITSNKIVQATFNILRLQVDGVVQTDDLDKKKNYLLKVPDNVPFNVGYIVRTSELNGPQERWSKLKIPKLTLIIEQIDRRMGKCKQAAANYDSIITAMIYIRKIGYDIPKSKKYNIDYAKECTKQWLRQYPDDIVGHFMRGVLFTVSGLETGDIQTVDTGRESMKRCFDLCTERKTAHRRYKYAIGKGKGLAAVVPVEDDDKVGEIHNLRAFEGRLTKKCVTFSDGVNSFIATVSRKTQNDLVISPDQENLLTFNVVFAKAGLQAVNVELKRV